MNKLETVGNITEEGIIIGSPYIYVYKHPPRHSVSVSVYPITAPGKNCPSIDKN